MLMFVAEDGDPLAGSVFDDVFRKGTARRRSYTRDAVERRCRCYCLKCSGDWWTGVTNALAVGDLFYYIVHESDLRGCVCVKDSSGNCAGYSIPVYAGR